MKNPFARSSRESSSEAEALAAARREREREENERFMQQLYAHSAAPDPRSRGADPGAPVHGAAGFEHSIGEPTGPGRSPREPSRREPGMRDAEPIVQDRRGVPPRDAQAREARLREAEAREAQLREAAAREAQSREAALGEASPASEPAAGHAAATRAGAAGASAAAASPEAAVELLDVAYRLLEERDDTESRVVRLLVGRALDLMRGTPPS